MAIVITDNPSSLYRRKLTPSQANKEYIELRKKVTSAGILDPAYGYYFLVTITDFIGFFFSLYMLITQTNPVLVVGFTVLLAFFSVHIGGLIHDAGHRAIFKSVLFNDLAGSLFAAVITFPFFTWKYRHNAHHASTNVQGEDPDLDIPFLFTEGEHKKKGGFAKLIGKYQMWLYYPLGSLVSITYRTKAFMYYAKHIRTPKIFIETVIMGAGILLWYIAPFIFFPFWKALAFFIIYNEVAGFFMLNIFAPNHKGMPQLEKNTTLSFLEQQIVTSRNLRGNPLIDYLYIGLNYQIEHHLFPNCPRNKLKKIRPYLIDLCKKYKLDYVEMGPIESNIFILKELNDVATQ